MRAASMCDQLITDLLLYSIAACFTRLRDLSSTSLLSGSARDVQKTQFRQQSQQSELRRELRHSNKDRERLP